MKVLLVRLSSMGDLIHTLPAISDLAQECPDVELHWLCESAFSDIAHLHPFVKKIYPMQWRKWRKNLFKPETWSLIGELKNNLQNEHYDLVIDAQGLVKSAAFAKFAQAPIAGLDKKSARESLAAIAYSKTFFITKQKDAVWRNRHLFAEIFNYKLPELLDFGIQIPLETTISNLPEIYRVALHATSRDNKLWPQENWLQLLSQLYQEDGLPILLTWGSDKEYRRAQALADALPNAQICPKLDLSQAAYVLQKAQAIIGVDTGLLHLANAVNRPLVGIYTASNPAKTGVQTSSWAVNLGGIGQVPNVSEVYTALKQCEAAFISQ